MRSVDFSLGMVRKAREKARRKGLSSLYFIVGDVAFMPFKENVFECVTCSHAMYELSSRVRIQAFREIHNKAPSSLWNNWPLSSSAPLPAHPLI
ncbi:MAG: class I SAM-dependent methyltransferase [bacterium]